MASQPILHPPTVIDHRGATPIMHPVHDPSFPTHGPIVRHPPVPTRPAPSREHPPTSHHRHHDYVYVEGYDWWPQWFPYWEPYWYWYWQYLYDYYGGDANAEYAEYARDWALRSIAPQWGWL